MEKKHEWLGKKVEDTISGFEGTVIGVVQYLHSTTQAQVQGGLSRDGKPIITWFEMSQLKVKE
jgi:hypothetical protein